MVGGRIQASPHVPGEGPDKKSIFFSNAAHVFVLGNFAVAQPILEILGRQAEFFIARQSAPVDLLLLIFCLCILFPGILAGVDYCVWRIHSRVAWTIHGLILWGLLTAVLLPVLKKLEGFSDGFLLWTGIGTGLLGTAIYFLFRPVRMFLTVLIPAPVIFIVVFLMNPHIQQVLFPKDSFEGYEIDIRSPASVVMVVFDELPLTSLLDEDGAIDSSLYPHFAALARGATWYRNTTSISGITTVAVPAILTGKYPGKNLVLQTAENHPYNLFTLLGAHYRLNVQETLSQLCPETLCNRQSVQPPVRVRLGGLFSDVAILYGHILFPESVSNELPSVRHTWGNFGGEGDSQRGETGDTRVSKKVRQHVLWTDWSSRFSTFLDSLEPSSKPTLHFIHVLLPHVPWRYLPSGRTYGSYGAGFLGIDGLQQERWSEDSWAVAQGFQRHLLQLGFVDRLLGHLLEKLRAVDLYESALVVVTADHGASFRPGEFFRRPSETNHDDIMYVPLFIKSPGQSEAIVRDIHVETIDIFPTMAEILGIEIPWNLDGRSVLGSVGPSRNRKTVFDTTRNRINLPMTFNKSREGFERTLSRKISLFGTGKDPYGLFRIGPYGHLVGISVDQLPVSGLSGVEIEWNREIFSRNPVTGKIFPHGSSAQDRLHVAVVVNGRVGAVTRSYPLSDAAERFSAFVPEPFLGKENFDISFFLVSGNPRQPVVKKVPTRNPAGFIFSESEEGDRLVSSGGEVVRVVRNGKSTGAVTQVAIKDHRLVFTGWVLHRGPLSGRGSVLIMVDGQSVYQGRPNRPLPVKNRENPVPQGFVFELPQKRISMDSELNFYLLSGRKEAFPIGWTREARETFQSIRSG